MLQNFTSFFKIQSSYETQLRHISVLRLFKKRKEKTKPSHYIYMRAQPRDKDAIINLMKESYFIDEPTYSSVNVRNPSHFIENVKKSLAEGLTYIAKCKYDQCLVGACINSTSNPWDADLKEKFACHVKDVEMRKLYLFYAYIQRAPSLYNCYNVSKVYEINYVFVHPQHRIRGIGKELIELSKRLGRDCGYKIIRCDASNEFVAQICERLGMKKIFELPYCAYIGHNMKPVFTPMPPHGACKTYIFNNNEFCWL